jgi:ribonuclease Z
MAGGKVTSPTGTAPDRYVYYPGTEELGADEMRVIACGTGMPTARRSQAAASWVAELGNGDKFIIDIGSGSMANIQSLMIPANFLTKIFLTHLHTDHWADLTSIWAGGWTAGRSVPLAVTINPIPGEIKVHEFDYRALNEVVYEENGVTFRSWPCIHAGDGPVSLALEWNGYKVVFGGDTAPNIWYPEYAKGADLAIHECWMTADQMMSKYNQPAQLALRINLKFHTSAQSFGQIMSMVQPRHAVAYHFFNDDDTRYGIYEAVRENYAGPLSMATDMMVWNITRDGVTERMGVSTDNSWDVEGPSEELAPDPSRASEYTKFTLDGALDVDAANARWVKEFMAKTGLTPEDLERGG